MNYDHNKFLGLFKFQLGYRKLYYIVEKYLTRRLMHMKIFASSLINLWFIVFSRMTTLNDVWVTQVRRSTPSWVVWWRNLAQRLRTLMPLAVQQRWRPAPWRMVRTCGLETGLPDVVRCDSRCRNRIYCWT